MAARVRTRGPKDLLKEWDQLTADEKKMFLRQADVFAAYVAYTDHEIGRVIQAVADMGKLDNTLIIYINGDNGTSAEGTLIGTPNEVAMFNGVEVPVALQLKEFYDVWGSDQTYNHMAVPWAWAFDTPFSWTKQVASHFGGIRQGMAISWPAVIKDKGGIRHQFHHVIDIVPTILDATRIKAPKVVDGIEQSPIEGVSMLYTFDKTVPAHGDDRGPGRPEVPAVLLRAAVEGARSAETRARGGGRAAAACRSTDARRVPQQGRGADRQQDVRMRDDSLKRCCRCSPGGATLAADTEPSKTQWRRYCT